MKMKFLTAIFILLSVANLSAQESGATALSLKECVQIASEKNINVSQAIQDREKSRQKIEEARSSLLPQVEVGGTFQDNTRLAVTVIPGDFIGQPGTTIPFTMGVQYSAAANISANQVLYNQTALTALKLSKKAEYVSKLGVQKAKEEIVKEVGKLYFLIQTTSKQRKLVEDNIARTQRMADIVKRQLDNGVAKKVDYNRIIVSVQNLQTQLDNTKALYEQQLNLLKYTLEIPLNKDVVLTDSADMVLVAALPTENIDFSDHIDVQMLEAQKDVALLNQKLANAGYLPSVALFGQFGYQGMRNEFKDYFNNSAANKWYNSSYIGLKLTIPVFDGFQKRSKYRQAKADYIKNTLNLDNTKRRFSADYKNAMNNYYNNKITVERQQNNIDLAQQVYNETSLKYKEGMATMSDLLQDEVSLNNAQSGYLDALYKFKEAELEIMSLDGEIRSWINK
nr:TolC family protein [uncultured Bacteroides sp.]